MLGHKRRKRRASRLYDGGPVRVLRQVSGLDAEAGSVVDGSQIGNARLLIRVGKLEPLNAEAKEALLHPRDRRKQQGPSEQPTEPPQVSEGPKAEEGEAAPVEAAEGPLTEDSEWDSFTVVDLRTLLRESGVQVGQGLRKAELVEMAKSQL